MIIDTPIVIGGIVGTVGEHIALFREEGQSERTIDYFVGLALGRALDGETPAACDVPMAAYREWEAKR